jgi:hypothetical protein
MGRLAGVLQVIPTLGRAETLSLARRIAAYRGHGRVAARKRSAHGLRLGTNTGLDLIPETPRAPTSSGGSLKLTDTIVPRIRDDPAPRGGTCVCGNNTGTRPRITWGRRSASPTAPEQAVANRPPRRCSSWSGRRAAMMDNMAYRPGVNLILMEDGDRSVFDATTICGHAR